MEDDGGQLLVSPVDPEIKDAMRRVVNYMEKAHKVKAKKVKLSKFKKTLPMWLANMSAGPDKGFAYELANRQGRINVLWEMIKIPFFLSNHTLVAIITTVVEMFGVKHGTEIYHKLIQESKDFYREFVVSTFLLIIIIGEL